MSDGTERPRILDRPEVSEAWNVIGHNLAPPAAKVTAGLIKDCLSDYDESGDSAHVFRAVRIGHNRLGPLYAHKVDKLLSIALDAIEGNTPQTSPFFRRWGSEQEMEETEKSD